MTRMLAAVFAIINLALCAASSAADDPALWPKATNECRPAAYWWWMGSAVNPDDISRELDRYRAAGMGGVHIIPIYGAKGYEKQYIDYLSPKWMDMLRHTVGEAARRDMFVDMSLGSGWCFGGPSIGPQEACARIDVKTFAVAENAAWRLPREIKNDEKLQALFALAADGKMIDLKKKLGRDDATEWRAPAGKWTVYAVSQKPSGCPVKRAAPGGAGPMLNPFSADAMQHFLARFTKAFDAYDGPKPRAAYQDSYEYNSTWSSDLLDEFARRRGYRLESELPVLLSRRTDDHAARVKADYRQTISDMMVENTAPLWIKWSHDRGFIARYEAHGSPANLLDLYAMSDSPETEMFNKDRSVFISKFASSAAHTAGRKLVSSETGTWLKEHFTETLADVKDLVDQLFLSGINHVFYHGTCYSPDDAAWPGWVFYASTQMNPRNSIWRDVPALNAYITRCQAVLQAGKPDNDLLVYWPVHDLWHSPGGLEMKLTVHDKHWLGDSTTAQVSQTLWNRGYGFDYVSDRQLTTADVRDGALQLPGGKYRAVIVPPCKLIPHETLERLAALADAGATVIFADHLPKDVPGAGDLQNRRQKLHAALDKLRQTAENTATLQEKSLGKGRAIVGPLPDALAAAGIVRETMADQPGVQFIRRATDDGGRFYFICCRGEKPIDGWLPLGTAARAAAILDPMTNRFGAAKLRKNDRNTADVFLQLAPGQSLVLKTFTDSEPNVMAWKYYRPAGESLEITGTWRVKFIEGGPELPPDFETAKLDSWAKLGGPAAEKFAGAARYSIAFDVPSTPPGDWEIDLGRVCQSARVRLNGQSLGTVFTNPMRVQANRSLLKPTGNLLEVEVTNVSANRIRDLDRRGVKWKKFNDINFVSIEYKPFDASKWPLTDSGLLGPVRLSRIEPVAP